MVRSKIGGLANMGTKSRDIKETQVSTGLSLTRMKPMISINYRCMLVNPGTPKLTLKLIP